MGASWCLASPTAPVEADYFVCACMDDPDHYLLGNGGCDECNNTGAVRIERPAASMHITYGNTYALLKALGFTVGPDEYYGALSYAQVREIVTERIERLEGAIRERYYTPLSHLCAAALYHKCGISWG